MTTGRVLSKDGGPERTGLAQSTGTSVSRSIAYGHWPQPPVPWSPVMEHLFVLASIPHLLRTSLSTWPTRAAVPTVLRTRVAAESLGWGGRVDGWAVRFNSMDLAVHLPVHMPTRGDISVAKSSNLDICVPCGQRDRVPLYWCKHLCFIRFTLFLFFYFELYTLKSNRINKKLIS